MKKTIALAFYFLLCIVRLSAQSNTGALGGEATGSGGSASFTAGEVFYTYKTGATGSSTDGMQQTYNPTYPPTIISFTPSSGAPGTLVTITGNNFNATAANNIVFFGAVQATVSAATETSLSVIAPAGATYAPITVLNTDITLAASSSQPFLPNFAGKGSITGYDFMPKVGFATTGTQQPYYVAIGDIDGDGKPDLSVANYANGTVSVYHNTSSSGSITSASFAARVDFVTGGNPISLAIGDLNGDGKPELAVANYGSASVSVFRNTASNGSITSASFAAKVDLTTGTNPRSLAIGDLDGDGKADLVVANTAVSTVSILRNTFITSAISFAAKVDYATGAAPHFVTIGDLDGDNKPDLATANNGSASASVLRNNSAIGTIAMEAKVDFTAGSSPVSLAIGDLDADGKAEMVVTNFGNANVSVFKNNAVSGAINTTSFETKVDFATGAGAWAVAIGDLDGDNKPDLAVANVGVASVSVLRNTTSTALSFAPKVDFATSTATRSVAIGDLDLDGKSDMVAANYTNATISVFRNDPSGFVIYNANGGLGSMANQKISYLASANITVNGLTREGFIFTGWNTEADGTATPYENLAIYTMGASDVTLYAQWCLLSSSTEIISACVTYDWHGSTYTTSNNTATWIGINAAGCDSVVTLNLTITPQPLQPQIECYQTATFNTQTCSWVVTGSPAPAIVTNASACESYTWEANGQSYTSSGNYTFSENCQDYTLNLTINQATTSTVNATITQGESYSFNGQNLTTAGTFNATLQNAAGCDSIVTLNLSITPAPVAGCYASSVVNFNQGPNVLGSAVSGIRSNATKALGQPEAVVTNVVNFVSLGFGGTITVALETPIANGAGNDIRLDEATWGNNPCSRYPEKADVFASQDGTNFIYLGQACQDATFDLGALSWAKYIRLVDVSDILSFNADADGYDLNGIECLNGSATNPTNDGLEACTLQEIVSYAPGNRKNGTAVPSPRNNANNALGMPQSNNTVNFVALGFGGTLVAKFDYVVFNQPGNDLQVTETSYGNPSCTNYPEKARVSLSLDNQNWIELGEICQDGAIDMGTMPYAQYIRIQDATPMSSSKFNGSADGYDVDAVVVLNNGCGTSSARLSQLDNTTTPDEALIISAFPNPIEDYTIVNFEGLESDSHFNFQIMDASGRLVRNENIHVSANNPTYMFDASELARGIYQVVLSNEKGNQIIRLVK